MRVSAPGRRAPVTCGALALFLSSALGAVGAPTMVADLSQSLRPRASYPREIYRLGGRVIFAASDPAFGYELRSWNIATGTTELLVDGNPGTGPSNVVYAGDVEGRLLYWVGWYGYERLYATDGTRIGSGEVVDLEGARIHFVYQLSTAKAGGRRVLKGFEWTDGRAGLWGVGSDGRAERLWRPIPEDNQDPWISSVVETQAGTYFLERDDYWNATSLWVTDGTTLGTRLVRRLTCAAEEAAIAMGERLLFTCLSYDPGDTRSLLYSSDGTAAGTVAIGSWSQSEGDRFPRLLGANSARSYFSIEGGDGLAHLWLSDGTASGTRRVVQAAAWRSLASSDDPAVWFGDDFYFWAADGTWPNDRRDYWVHDGSDSAPRRMRTGALGEHSWLPPLLPSGDRLLFISLDAAGEGEEIWAKPQGSAEAEQLSDLCPGLCFEFHWRTAADLGESVVYDLGIQSSMFGSSWLIARSDGTVDGTRLLARSWEGEAEIYAGYPGAQAAIEGGYLVSASSPKSSWEPWFVDELTGEARPLVNLEPENGPAWPLRLVPNSGQLYFLAPGVEESYAPWWLEKGGAPQLLTPIGCPGSYDFAPAGQVRGTVLVSGDSGCLLSFDPAEEVWETLADSPDEYVAVGSVVSDDGVAYFMWSGSQLWQSDGTRAGTRRMSATDFVEDESIVGVTPTHVYLRSGYSLQTLTAVRIVDGVAEPLMDLSEWNLWPPTHESRAIGSQFYFTSRTSSESERLWISRGSVADTFVLWSGAGDERLLDLYEFAGELYFVVAGERAALWRSDGTTAGTRPLADLGRLPADPDDTRPRSGLALGDRLYFVVENVDLGIELWSSDGTTSGTAPLDLVPGADGSDPRELTVVGGRLFFSAADRAFGRELWSIDPANGRASRAGDIADGDLSSVPEELTAVGSTLYFAADDGIHGRELWSLDTSAPPAPCVPSPGRLCLLDGRFEVEAFWRDFRDRSRRAAGTLLAPGSAYFSFLDGGGAELLLKLVQVCAASGREETWIYGAGLTNLDVTLALRDTRTNERVEWRNELGQTFAPRVARIEGGACAAVRSAADDSVGGGESRLELIGGRFFATIEWVTASGRWVPAAAVALDDRSGYFWFFSQLYPEVLVRMVDACGLSGFDNFWLLAGGLTDVEVHLSVTDRWSGEVVHHHSRQGNLFPTRLETGAFPVCTATP